MRPRTELRRTRRPGMTTGTPAAVPEAGPTSALFGSALTRERNRADRFDEAFALITVNCSACPMPSVLEAAAAVAPDNSVIGWMVDD